MIKYPDDKFFKSLDKKLQDMCRNFDKVCDIEVIATSGLRSPEHNAEVGGSPTSSHLKGLAIDLATPDSKTRYKILWAAIAVGFNRIGLPTEFDHIHLDCDADKPWPAAFKD